MLYRENGQFKTTYRSDQQVFPITQDRLAIWLLIAFAVVGVPLLVDEYLFRAILIPFLILSLAALGLNILVGYCGQISLGTGAFMAVGAYAAYNFMVRIDGMPMLVAILLGGVCATLVGVLFGILPKLYSGAHVHHPKVRTARGTSFRFDAAGVETLVDLDGEMVGRLPLEVTVLPQAFRVGAV